MGCVDSIGISKMPKQGTWLGRRVDVCFHYNTSQTIGGVIVREDDELPGVMIIKLDDGRHLLATECQYSLMASPKSDWSMN